MKNRLSSFINVFGLATGIAVAIIIFLSIKTTLGFNTFHLHYDSIYALMKTQWATDATTGSVVPGQLAPAIKAEFPEVNYAARGAFDEPQLKYGDKSIYQLTLYTDPEFFDIMTFPAVEGNVQQGLQQTNSIVLTESAARRLFGNTAAVGKTLIQNNASPLRVVAIIKDIPDNSMYHFDAVMPFSFYEKNNEWLKKWDDNRILTWLQLKSGTDINALNHRLTAMLQRESGEQKVSLFAYPLRDVWLHNSFRQGKPNGGRIQGILLLAAAGLLVLLIACANFMNLSTARSEMRFREAGVRRTLGASRIQLILQFMTEAFLLTCLAALFGILLSKFFLPFFNKITDGHISFDLLNRQTITGLIGIIIFTSLVSGSYPAFFLSRPQPATILKGADMQRKSGFFLRKALVSFQFAISIVLMIGTIVLLRQQQHVKQRPIGYDPENLIDIPARGDLSEKFELFKNELSAVGGITSISAGTDDLIHFGAGSDGIEWPGKTADQDFYVKMTSVQYNWIKTSGLQLAEGRDFSREYGSDSLACLVNETAVRKMNLKEPVTGTRIGDKTIIGVVKDFIFNDVFGQPEPMVIYLSTGRMDHFFIRVQNNDQWRATIKKVERIAKNITTDFPFEYRFVSEKYQQQFQGIEISVRMINYLGALTIIISCLGLFGLSVFIAERRTKEIGIRKILGAGLMQLWFMLSRDFLKPVIISFIIAAPLSGWAIQAALNHIDYRIPLSWDIFAIAGIFAVIIALATVSIQAIRSTTANPIAALRSE